MLTKLVPLLYLQVSEMDWETAEKAAGDRPMWRGCVGRCVGGARTD